MLTERLSALQRECSPPSALSPRPSSPTVSPPTPINKSRQSSSPSPPTPTHSSSRPPYPQPPPTPRHTPHSTPECCRRNISARCCYHNQSFSNRASSSSGGPSSLQNSCSNPHCIRNKDSLPTPCHAHAHYPLHISHSLQGTPKHSSHSGPSNAVNESLINSPSHSSKSNPNTPPRSRKQRRHQSSSPIR